jgi:hypothetical protein
MVGTSVVPIVHHSMVHPVTPPHPSLVAPSATSTGDLTMAPLSSLRLTVAHQEPMVLGESMQEALVVRMP